MQKPPGTRGPRWVFEAFWLTNESQHVLLSPSGSTTIVRSPRLVMERCISNTEATRNPIPHDLLTGFINTNPSMAMTSLEKSDRLLTKYWWEFNRYRPLIDFIDGDFMPEACPLFSAHFTHDPYSAVEWCGRTIWNRQLSSTDFQVCNHFFLLLVYSWDTGPPRLSFQKPNPESILT